MERHCTGGRAVRRRLEKRMRKTKDVWEGQRIRIVLHLLAGDGVREIARGLWCSPATVVRVRERWERYGEVGLVDGRVENGRRVIDADLLEALGQLLGQDPRELGWERSTWTRELLGRQLELELGVRVSRTTVGRGLRRLRARWGRPRPVVYGWLSDKARRAWVRRVKRAQKRLEGRGAVVLYADEMDVELNPRIGPQWQGRGQQHRVVTPGQNEKRYVAGALNATTGNVVWVIGERKNTDLFLDLLDALRRAYRHYPVIGLILDNYSIHHSQRTQAALTMWDGRFELVFLPPYTPQENRIERLWREVHANVTRNHRCRTMEELLEQIDGFLESISPHARTLERAA